MRILIATDAWHPQVNGVVRTLTSLAKSAVALGAEIEFLTPDGFPSMAVPTYPSLRMAWPNRREIARRVEAASPDAIHIATEGPVGWAVRAYCLRHKLAFTTSYTTRFPEYIAVRSIIPEWFSYAVLRHFHSAAAMTMVATASLKQELAARGFRKLGFWTRGVDTDLFRPDDETMYPPGRTIGVTAGTLGAEWEGKSRPGHFDGMLTVVAKLLNIVQPDVAVFGQKDLQQAALVRALVRDLNMPLEILVAPIIREDDGIAMSSRNRYLNESDRQKATVLSRAIRTVKQAFDGGERSVPELESIGKEVLASEPDVKPDYLAVIDRDTFVAPAEADDRSSVIVAARVGTLAALLPAGILGPGLRSGRCGGGTRALLEPAGIVLEVAVEVADHAVGHQPELVADAAQEAAVVRHHDDRAGEILQRGDQRVPHLEIEVVGGLVEQQQVGSFGHQDGERQAGALAAREMHHGFEYPVAAEAEAAEVVAAALLVPLRTHPELVDAARERHERRVARVQPVDFELREVADDEIGRGDAVAA